MSSTAEEAAVTRVLADYYSAFSSACSTLDVHAIWPYFHEPALLIGPGGMLAAPTREVLPTAFTPAMEDLRARGFGRSELNMRDIKLLNATTMLVSGVAMRYKLDGRELERAGVTYVLHKAASGWKIAVLIGHDTESPRRE
jgi:hypothetical protein